jgi:hypothetical protein
MNYFDQYHGRFLTLKEKLETDSGFSLSIDNDLKLIIEKHPTALKNLILAGLGMGTLYLRMGAILMIGEKTKVQSTNEDMHFLKIVAENLFDQLPTDGNWMNIWEQTLKNSTENKWREVLSSSKNKELHKKFVTFRNDFAHQDIRIDPLFFDKLKKGIHVLNLISHLNVLFKKSSIEEYENQLFFKDQDEIKTMISPYVQVNKEKNVIDTSSDLPYLFQGVYRKGSKFINAIGGETVEEEDPAIEQERKTIKGAIAGFVGNEFDLRAKRENYKDWYIGREKEVQDIKSWILDFDSEKNVLPIFSAAGIGKGALINEVITQLKKDKINCLYHFCGTGQANNLQAVLYHFIIQGENKSYWVEKDLPPKIQPKLSKLPSLYPEAIEFFQYLLRGKHVDIDELRDAIKSNLTKNDLGRLKGYFKMLAEYLIPKAESEIDKSDLDLLVELAKRLKGENGLNSYFNRYLYDIYINLNKINVAFDLLDLIPIEDHKHSKNYKKPLVIILDGLDEAAVSDFNKKISDWFYTYNEKGERIKKWTSPKHIKWIFTYRYTEEMAKIGYQFEKNEFKTMDMPSVQPLNGLTDEDVRKGLLAQFPDRNISDDFITAIIQKGSVK